MDADETRIPAAKRPRMEATSVSTPEDVAAPISTVFRSLPMSAQQSIGSLLSIPVAFVFRTCASQEGRPLLTRAEAECFLRISFLAQEIDTLIGSSESIFLPQRYYSQYTQDLLLPSSTSNSSQPPSSQDAGSHTTANALNPMLRPLPPILMFLECKSAPTLQNIYPTLSNLAAELFGCSSILRQSAEQNWTLADTLEAMQHDDSEQCPSMSDEKRKVADLEEELCQRIERVVGMSLAEGCEDEKSTSSARLSQSSQDNQYRRKLFADSDDQEEEVEVDSDGDNSQGNGKEQSQVPCGSEGKEEVAQQYALDWKPISEYCSELFNDVVHVDSSQEETKEDENGEGVNSNDNGTDDRMHLDELQGGEENGDGDAFENSRRIDDRGNGNAAENGEMEVDLVESRIEVQTGNENSADNVGSIPSTEHTNEYYHNDEQTTEIDKESQRSIQGQATVHDRATSGVDEEVDEFPPTQEQDNHSSENQSDRLPFPNVPPDENEKHPVMLPAHITTQPERSSFPLTEGDDIEEDDDDVRSERLMCSQRTSSAAEALTILGSHASRNISLY